MCCRSNSMFVRPRLSRIWIVLAGGTLLTLFGLAVRRNSNTVLDGGLETGGGKVSLEFKYDQLISKANKKTLIPLNQSISHPLPLVPEPIHQHHRDGTKHQLTNTPGRFQIHIRPLKYSTSELQAKLDLLQPDHAETDSLIGRQLHICSKLENRNDNTSAYYPELISSSLEAWHDFIPEHRDMISSHCWYTDTFKKLNPTLEKKISRWNSLYHITEQYSKDEVLNTLSSVLASIQRAVLRNTTRKSTGINTFLCVPKVYLGGFPKCGTTALYSYLSSHPSIVEPYTKEGQFWREFVLAEDKDYRRLEVLLYLYHFKGAAGAIKYNKEKRMTLDASASTVFASAQRWFNVEKDVCVVPHLLSKVLPSTKFVFIMRDPVERLWSDYWYFCSKDHFGSQISEELLNRASEIFHNHSIAVVEEFIDCVSQGRSEFECTMLAHSDAGENSACRNARIGLSLYYFHVIRWLSVFPREQILFLTLEELKHNTYSVLQRAWRFLGLSPLSKHQLPKHVTSNSNLWIKSEQYKDRFKMWPETEHILRSFFRPYNVRLAKLLRDNKLLWET